MKCKTYDKITYWVVPQLLILNYNDILTKKVTEINTNITFKTNKYWEIKNFEQSWTNSLEKTYQFLATMNIYQNTKHEPHPLTVSHNILNPLFKSTLGMPGCASAHPLEKTESFCCHNTNLNKLTQIVAMDSPCLETYGIASTHVSTYANWFKWGKNSTCS